MRSRNSGLISLTIAVLASAIVSTAQAADEPAGLILLLSLFG